MVLAHIDTARLQKHEAPQSEGPLQASPEQLKESTPSCLADAKARKSKSVKTSTDEKLAWLVFIVLLSLFGCGRSAVKRQSPG